MKGVLDKGGALLALVFGAILFVFGGPEYLALMLFFFISESGSNLAECIVVRRTDMVQLLQILNKGVFQKVKA